MENKERYNHLNEYYKNKFGERTLKICIDAGFTCPNRDGTLSSSGCIFCSEKGAGELIKFSKLHISEQVNNFLNSYRGMRANKFIVYFQNFTNTYDSLENLKEKSPIEIFENLYEKQNASALNDEQTKLLKDIVKEVWEGEKCDL